MGSAELKPTKLYKAFVLYPSESEVMKVTRGVFQGMINDGRFFKRGFVAPVIFFFFCSGLQAYGSATLIMFVVSKQGTQVSFYSHW